jgi:hypothetical protein
MILYQELVNIKEGTDGGNTPKQRKKGGSTTESNLKKRIRDTQFITELVDALTTCHKLGGICYTAIGIITVGRNLEKHSINKINELWRSGLTHQPLTLVFLGSNPSGSSTCVCG